MKGPSEKLGPFLLVPKHSPSLGGTEGFIPNCATAEKRYRDILSLFKADGEEANVRFAHLRKTHGCTCFGGPVTVWGVRI